jgi:hypothetical protein
MLYDGAKILAGLIIGLAFFVSPFIYDAGKPYKKPEPRLTEKAKKAKECVASKAFMRSWHMQLLDEWRNEVVRKADWYYRPRKLARHMTLDKRLLDQWRHYISDGTRRYVPKTDKIYYKSLQNTCLDCHSNKSKFCDECHDYLGVHPYCWNCHIAPEEKK